MLHPQPWVAQGSGQESIGTYGQGVPSQTRRHWPHSAGPQKTPQPNLQEFSGQIDKESQGRPVSYKARDLQMGVSAQSGD